MPSKRFNFLEFGEQPKRGKGDGGDTGEGENADPEFVSADATAAENELKAVDSASRPETVEPSPRLRRIEPADETFDNTPFGPAHLPDLPPPAPPRVHESNGEHADFGPRQYDVVGAVDDADNGFADSASRGGDGETGRGISTYSPPAASSVHRAGSLELRAVEFFGSRGTAAGQFNFPAGIAVDRSGILFVADVYNHRVQRITPDGGVAIVGSRGSGRTQFLAPTGVAVDAERAFYVVEQGNHRVQKFSAEGVLQLVFGRMGNRPGEFQGPMGICVALNGDILVADTGNGRVQRFSRAGQYLSSMGVAGSLQPPLTNPQAVTTDSHGNIYVADTLAHRIARYDPLGRFTGHFGGVIKRRKPGGDNGGGETETESVRFTEPHGIACTLNGQLFISDGDHGPGRLVALSAETGAVQLAVTDPGRNLGKLSRPSGVAISARMRSDFPDGLPRADLYLADSANHRIIRFTST